ncbi:iron-sulfur cluster biosynthesis family protein [Fulvitalea axinellae]
MIAPIKITPTAAVEVKKIMAGKNIPEGYCLRIDVKGGGGCGGVGFVLGFDKEKEGDDTFDIEGIPTLIAKKATMFLLGKVVDFHEGNDSRGFFFRDEKKD